MTANESTRKQSNRASLSASRYFLALWPDSKTAIKLHDAAQKALSPKNIKIVDAARLHLTLLFLGTLNQEQLNRVITAIDALCLPSCILEFDSITYWSKAKIVCFGCTRQSPVLTRIHKKLFQSLNRLDLTLDARDFIPHLTLARTRLTHFTPLTLCPINWEVHQLCLMSSSSHRGRAEYRPIKLWQCNPII